LKQKIFVFLFLLLFFVPNAAAYTVTVNYMSPENLDTSASWTIGHGIEVNMTGNDNFTVYFFLTYANVDNDLVVYTTRSVTTNSSNFTVFATDIKWNMSYFVFIGVLMDSTPEYTALNFTFEDIYVMMLHLMIL
jgi:hypothetical protein